MTQVTNEVLAERIEGLFGRLDSIDGFLQRSDERARALEVMRVADQARIENKADAAHRRLDEHAQQLSQLHEAVKPVAITQEQIQTMRTTIMSIGKTIEPLGWMVWAFGLLAFLGSALMLAIIGLIWALVTGQAHISFTP